MNRARTGSQGEALAAEWYTANGYDICAKNYRARAGEVDLIVQKDGLLAFVEVKTRAEGGIALPREWVDARKQRRIVAAALDFLEKHCRQEPWMRFDVVEVTLYGNGGHKIHCIENAFSV